MLDNNKPSWVAVMTHPNAEMLVARRFAEAEPPVEHYLPLMRIKDRRFKQDSLPEKPMFPCYIFAHINGRQIYQTRTTKGVIAIVSSQHSIIPVPQSDIDKVKAFEASQRKIYIHQTSQLVKGTECEITQGEFTGMRGTLVRGCKDGNFCVNISVMNVSFVVRVKRDELCAVDKLEEKENKYLKSI